MLEDERMRADVSTTPARPALTAKTLVGLLAERERRRVVAALILGADTIEAMTAIANLDTRQVVDALERLQRAGLVEQVDDHYLVLEQAFKRAARSEADQPPASQFPDEPALRRTILDRAIVDGRLTRMPVKWSHKLIVLDWIVQRFEPGLKYTERQVNAMLVGVDTDTASLRRYLVEAAMLDRAAGEYWRCGGSVVGD